MTSVHRLAIGMALLALGGPLGAALPETIRVASGPLKGTASTPAGVTIFRGVPYAAPPVGNFRWQPPQPAPAWKETRETSAFGSRCMQGRGDAAGLSEDCLYLNIWTPAASAQERLPVMLWIHGGTLVSGAGSLPFYDGESLARKGVIFVSINYRLGALGFLAHPELTRESPNHSSGNYGFLDQIAALKWVRDNIAQFGGDPAKVTIFGESAGSWSVNVLTASPLAKGLFRAAIGESGAAFGPMQTLAECEKAGVRIAESLNATSLAELRALPATRIQSTPTLPLTMSSLAGAGLLSAPPIAANVDGWVLPAEIRTIYAQGRQNDVAVMAGFNADEGTTLVPAKTTLAELESMAKTEFGDRAPEFLSLYPATTDEQAWKARCEGARDAWFGFPSRAWIRAQKRPTWMYYFSHVPPTPTAARTGASHGAEIIYAMDNMGKLALPWRDSDRALAEAMSKSWVAFAKTGNPGWPAFDPKKEMVMGFGGAKPELIPMPHPEGLDFFEKHLAGLKAPGASR